MTEKFSLDLLKEVRFRTSRSGGAGGQHVNKVESRVELIFDVAASEALSLDQKNLLYEKLNTRIDKKGLLRVVGDESRSQIENKEIVKEKFLELIISGLKRPKKRRPTKPTKGSTEKRIETKKKRSSVKKMRGKPFDQ